MALVSNLPKSDLGFDNLREIAMAQITEPGVLLREVTCVMAWLRQLCGELAIHDGPVLTDFSHGVWLIARFHSQIVCLSASTNLPGCCLIRRLSGWCR